MILVETIRNDLDEFHDASPHIHEETSLTKWTRRTARVSCGTAALWVSRSVTHRRWLTQANLRDKEPVNAETPSGEGVSASVVADCQEQSVDVGSGGGGNCMRVPVASIYFEQSTCGIARLTGCTIVARGWRESRWSPADAC